MRELKLLNGNVSLLDDDDFTIYSQWPWKQEVNGGYVTRKVGSHASRVTIYLHKEIVKHHYGWSQEADHKDRDVLNNQKENLRPATRSENAMNQAVRVDSTTGYKGVYYDRSRIAYVARIWFRGKKIWIGRFRSATEAAKAYDHYAKAYHKEFAFLNFPENV